MQFGKPSKATYEFAEQVLKTQIEQLYGSVKKLPNMYAIWNTILLLLIVIFMVDTWLEVNLSKCHLIRIFANSAHNSFRQSRIGYEPYIMISYQILTWMEKDIAGANAAKWCSILVNTGVFDPSQGLPTHSPTFFAEDVEEAVTWAVAREYRTAGGKA